MKSINPITIIISVVSSLALLFGLIWLVSDEVDNNTVSFDRNAYRKEFIRSCVVGDENLRSYCTCTADYILAYNTSEDLMRLSDEMIVLIDTGRSGDITSYPDELMDAVKACIYHVK